MRVRGCQWLVIVCAAQVAHIERLVRDLNADNNFQAFVCSGAPLIAAFSPLSS
eukprot:SAG31_NODE_4605_length_3098_cov_20.002001_6_plen_52_part_01